MYNFLLLNDLLNTPWSLAYKDQLKHYRFVGKIRGISRVKPIFISISLSSKPVNRTIDVL